MQGTLFWHVQDGHAKENKNHGQVHILYIKANMVSVCVDKNWAVPGRFQSLPVLCGAFICTYIISLVLSPCDGGGGWSSSVPSSKFLIPGWKRRMTTNGGRNNFIQMRSAELARWWWGAWAVASDDGRRCWPFLIQKKNTRNLTGDYIS
jgi:hypothetical protein